MRTEGPARVGSPERAELPVGPGLRTGNLRARMSVAMSGFSMALSPSGDAVMTPLEGPANVCVDFWTELYHRALPTVALTFSGGPHPGPTFSDVASFTREQLQMYLLRADGEYVGDATILSPTEMEVGSWPIADIPSDPFSPPYRARLEYWDDPIQWIGEAGEIRLDLVKWAPAADLTGELRGAIDVDLVSRSGGSAPGDTGQRMQLSGTFHVPSELLWLAASPALLEELQRWAPAVGKLLGQMVK